MTDIVYDNNLVSSRVHNREYTLSDAILFPNDAQVQIPDETLDYTTHTITIDEIYPSPTAVRVYFEAFRTNPSELRSRIYVNGSAIGTERLPDSEVTWQGWSEDLTIKRGDVLTLLGRNSSTGNCYHRKFRVLGTLIAKASWITFSAH